MPFLKRLGFFLAGLSVGLVFLAIFLRKKSDESGVEFCYFPNCRVLKELRSKPLNYSEQVQALINSGQLDSLAIDYFLREGDVDFGRSDPQASPCKLYFIESTYKQKEYLIEVHHCSDRVLIENLQ